MIWLYALAAAMASVQLSSFATTIYLHRGLAHRALVLHPAAAFLMRLHLWLATGIVPREWIAVHRKHHRFSDHPGDPHSPHVDHAPGWRGALRPDIYTAKYVWQDYYSKAKGWGEDWALVAANYREGWYGLPVPDLVRRAIDAGDPLTPTGWEYTKQGVLVPVRDRWQGWQFAADRNQLGATFGVRSRDIDLSIQGVEDDPTPGPPTEPPTDITTWLEELRAAHANSGRVIAEFPG